MEIHEAVWVGCLCNDLRMTLKYFHTKKKKKSVVIIRGVVQLKKQVLEHAFLLVSSLNVKIQADFDTLSDHQWIHSWGVGWIHIC